MESNNKQFGTIGGTTISAILGCNPWTSPLGAYLKLRREATESSGNSATERGIRFEDTVAHIFASNHSEFAVKHNVDFSNEPQRVADEEYPFITGSPDRLLFAPDAKVGDQPIAGLEIKTTSMRQRSQWGSFGSDKIPLHYMCQCQWYLGFYPWINDWHVAVQFFDEDDHPLLYGEYLVHRDDELIANLRRAGIDFWNNRVLTGNAPQCDSVDETVTNYVRSQWPVDAGETADASDEGNTLAVEYLQAKAEKERAEAAFEAVKTRLQMLIKDVSVYRTSHGNITWKKTKDKEVIDYKGLVEFLKPDEETIKQFTSVKEGYRLFNDRSLKLGNED